MDEVSSLTKDKTRQAHNNAAVQSDSTETNKDQGFYDYINSLDLDYEKYIHKNKETETEAVTHKNDVASDDSNTWFTNEDRSTQHSNAASEKTWHEDAVSSNPYFTNDDQSTHSNEASTKSWHSNDGNSSFFTNEDQSTGASSYHQNDSEWVSEDNVHATAADHENGWSSEDIEFDSNDHVNDAEWDDDVSHSNEWNDDAHNNGWSTEDIDVAHANSYVSKEAEEHVNDADFNWASEDIEAEDNHVNYHVNDAEWFTEDNHASSHNNGWESEDIELSNDHSNDNEWQEEADEHINATNWESEDVELDHDHSNSAEWVAEDDHATSHNNGWESEDIELSANDHNNDTEWEEEDDQHTNAAAWESEDVELSHDHSNSSEWVSDDDEHVNVAGGDWVSEDIEDEHVNEASSDWYEEHSNDANDWHQDEVELLQEDHTNNFNENTHSNEWQDESSDAPHSNEWIGF